MNTIPLEHNECKSKKSIRELNKIDKAKFRIDLKQKLPPPSSFTSLKDAVDTYDRVLSELLDDHAPLKVINVKENKSPWWNKKMYILMLAEKGGRLNGYIINIKVTVIFISLTKKSSLMLT